MICNTRILIQGIFLTLALLTSCSGGKSVSDDKVEAPSKISKVDADGEWRLVSYRIGHETRVYGKNTDYVLSFSDDDMSFDFVMSNDTIDGDYDVINDTIRFHPDDVDGESHDEVLMMLGDDCYGCQENDSIIITLPDDAEAVFARIKE